MSHMVIYRGADGKPGYHQTDDIHDAVMYVETLRNDKDVDHARIFRLEEVTFEYKPYYRVELSVGGAPAVTAGSERNGEDIVDTSEASNDDDDDTVEEVAEADGSNDGDDVADAGDETHDEGDDDDKVGHASGVRRGLFGR